MAAGPPTGPPPVKSPQLSLQSLRLDDPVPLTGPQSPSGHIQFLVKLLLSQAQAGSVIGKGGDSILAIQSSTGCKLRVAGPTDCYPGVSERVAALTGSVLPLTNALMHIIQRLSGVSFRDMLIYYI